MKFYSQKYIQLESFDEILHEKTWFLHFLPTNNYLPSGFKHRLKAITGSYVRFFYFLV